MTQRGLAPFTEKSEPGERYLERNTGDVWEVIGWITQPAAILCNRATGERLVEIIGSPDAERFDKLDSDAYPYDGPPQPDQDDVRDRVAVKAMACLDHVRKVRWGEGVASYTDNDKGRHLQIVISVKCVRMVT